MKTAMVMTPAEIREAAHDAIVRELGVVGLIRYLQDTSMGSGDYTRDRHQWLDKYKNLDDLWADIEAARERDPQ